MNIRQIANFADRKMTIMMYNQHAPNKEPIRNICVKMTALDNDEKNVLERIKNRFGGCITNNGRGRVRYFLPGKGVEKFLKAIQPHVRIQSKQLALGLKGADVCASPSERRKGVNKNTLRQRESIRNALSFLNNGEKRITKKAMTEHRRHNMKLDALDAEMASYHHDAPAAVKRYVSRHTNI